ncbi:MAG: DUF5676 family membrane protein [Pseudohongiellaceae bacterium]
MKLDASKFGLASAATVAVLWIICSLLVLLIPDMAMNASGYMTHADFSSMQWRMGFGGVLAGLALWSVIAGLSGWLLASIYNRLL